MDEDPDNEVNANEEFASSLEQRLIQLEGRLQSMVQNFTIVGQGISGSSGEGFEYNPE
jgi:hypothetical protein